MNISLIHKRHVQYSAICLNDGGKCFSFYELGSVLRSCFCIVSLDEAESIFNTVEISSKNLGVLSVESILFLDFPDIYFLYLSDIAFELVDTFL